jgi:hypothetical protein
MFTIVRARVAALALMAGAVLLAPAATYAATPDSLDLHAKQGPTTQPVPTNIPTGPGPYIKTLNLKVEYVGVQMSQNNHTATYTFHVISTGGLDAKDVKLEKNCVFGSGQGLNNQLSWQTIGTIPANTTQTYTTVCSPPYGPILGGSLKVYTSTHQTTEGDDWATN